MQLTSRKFAAVVGNLKQAAESSGSDKRQFTRIEVQARISMAILRNGELTSIFTGLTRDVSMAGLGIFQAIDLQAGTELVINLPGEDGSPLLMRCVVKHCRMIANGIFSVGATFVAEANDELAAQWLRSDSDATERIRSRILA